MHRVVEYIILFFVLCLLQFFLFNSLSMGVYINPLVYIAFIVLLPMQTSRFWVLMLSFLMGLTMDFMMGSYGINTIASLFVGFLRPFILALAVKNEDDSDKGVPCVRKMDRGRFIRYSSILVVLHCLVYFFFETATIDYFYYTLLRVVVSSVLTVALVYLCQYIFTFRK